MKISLAALACLVLSLPELDAQDHTDFPVVIHLGHELLYPIEKRTFKKKTTIQQTILGTSATGAADTSGKAIVSMTPARDDAKFLINFQGVVQTSTVGRNRSALIYSRSSTPFTCTCEVEFDFERGFIASTPSVTCATQLMFDDFDSTRRGLLGGVVRRVAERRANRSHELARRLVERENRLAITREFQTALDARLAAANRRTQTVKAVKSLFVSKKMKVKAVTSEDCLHLALYDQDSISDATPLPIARLSKSPVEIWVHSTMLGENGDMLIKTLGSIADLQAVLKTMPFLAALNSDDRDAWSLKTSSQWIVISLTPNAQVMSQK